MQIIWEEGWVSCVLSFLLHRFCTYSAQVSIYVCKENENNFNIPPAALSTFYFQIVA